MLTKAQEKVYRFVVKFKKKNDYAPTVVEIMNGLGFKSPNGIYQHLKLIEDKGVPQLDYLIKSYYSDVCVGLWARDNDIEMVDVKGFYSQDPSFYNLTDEDIKQSYTFHYMKTYNAVKDVLEKFYDKGNRL